MVTEAGPCCSAPPWKEWGFTLFILWLCSPQSKRHWDLDPWQFYTEIRNDWLILGYTFPSPTFPSPCQHFSTSMGNQFSNLHRLTDTCSGKVLDFLNRGPVEYQCQRGRRDCSICGRRQGWGYIICRLYRLKLLWNVTLMFYFDLPSSNKDCCSKAGRKVVPGSAGNIIELCLPSKDQRIRGQSHEYAVRRETISLISPMLKTTNFIIELY